MKLNCVSFAKVLPVCVCLLLASCFGKKSKEEPKDIGQLEQLNLPNWVLDPAVPGYISAVGISPKTAGGVKMQIAQAEADAAANIASQIQTVVSRVTKESMRRAGVADAVKNSEAVDTYFAQATKSVVKEVPVSGVKRKNIFQSPQDGTLYIHIVLDQTDVKKYLADMSKTVASGMADFDATQKTIASTENAMRDLFNEIDFSKENSKDNRDSKNANAQDANESDAKDKNVSNN